MPPKDKMKKMKTGSKVHVRMQVMLSRAFQNGQFPLARRKLLLSDNTRRKRPSQMEVFGAFSLHTVFAKIVFRTFASCLGRGAQFHEKRKIKEKSRQEASKIINYFAMVKMKQIMNAQRVQTWKVAMWEQPQAIIHHNSRTKMRILFGPYGGQQANRGIDIKW